MVRGPHQPSHPLGGARQHHVLDALGAAAEQERAVVGVVLEQVGAGDHHAGQAQQPRHVVRHEPAVARSRHGHARPARRHGRHELRHRLGLVPRCQGAEAMEEDEDGARVAGPAAKRQQWTVVVPPSNWTTSSTRPAAANRRHGDAERGRGSSEVMLPDVESLTYELNPTYNRPSYVSGPRLCQKIPFQRVLACRPGLRFMAACSALDGDRMTLDSWLSCL
jgi:hypothetical protein